jgi:hypothetical protein
LSIATADIFERRVKIFALRREAEKSDKREMTEIGRAENPKQMRVLKPSWPPSEYAMFCLVSTLGLCSLCLHVLFMALFGNTQLSQKSGDVARVGQSHRSEMVKGSRRRKTPAVRSTAEDVGLEHRGQKKSM